MNEQWIKWVPIEGLSSKYYVDSVSDDIEGFKIILSDSKNSNSKVHIYFEDSVDAYRSSDESLKWRDLHNLYEKYGNDFFSQWTFFKVMNSSYIQSACNQTYETLEPKYLTHFSIVALESVVDIINGIEPKVELIIENTET